MLFQFRRQPKGLTTGLIRAAELEFLVHGFDVTKELFWHGEALATVANWTFNVPSAMHTFSVRFQPVCCN